MDLPHRTLSDLRRIQNMVCNSDVKVYRYKDDLVKAILTCQRGNPIKVVKSSAPLIPIGARRRLLAILDGLSWDRYAVKDSRIFRSLASKSTGSLVLGATQGPRNTPMFDSTRGREGKAFNMNIITSTTAKDQTELLELWYIMKELVRSIDPAYHFSSIQINKDFTGLPHTDRNNVNYQYAMSLGEFNGGELVVSTDDPYLYVQHNTQNRLTKCDGRHPHWVTKHTGGVRYSLIMYDITGKKRRRLSNIPESIRIPSSSAKP